MDELSEEFRDWAVQKEIDFCLDGSVPGEGFGLNRQVWRRIVLNLLHNSFKYTKAGGAITPAGAVFAGRFYPSYAQ